jgi:RNA polymerase sigma-70 factor (ECF subfamily)
VDGSRTAAIDQHLAQGRHRRAFDLIVPEFQDRVFRLAYSMLRDRGAAEDASQETFVRVWKALPKFDGRAALGTWIYAIARNTCLMEIGGANRSCRWTTPIRPWRRQWKSRPRRPGGGPERDNLLRMVDRLPANQQQAVRLFYLEDRSYETVAELMGMPLGTVKNLLHRARKQLMQQARSEEVMAA